MAREVTNVAAFTHDPKFRLTKRMLVVRCDDGATYQFERPTDEPDWSLTKAFQPDGERTHTGSRKVLPSAVEETARSLIEL